MASGSDDAPAILKLIIDGHLIEPTVTYADVAACMLFVYDFCLTFDMEVRLVWKSRWNTIKVIYLLQRYLPFLDSCYLSLYRQLAFHLTVQECVVYSYTVAFIYLTGIMLSEVLLTSRVWAIWDRNRWLAVILPISLLAIFGGIYAALYIYLTGLEYTDFPLPGFNFQGYFIVGANNAVIWCWAGLMAWNSITLVLMLIPGVQAYRVGVTSRLTNVIYRDGVYYYVYLFILSSLNIVFASILPGQKRVLVTLIERNLHSIFGSRVLLHMRDQLSSNEHFPSFRTSQARTIEFGVVGNTSLDVENIQLSQISKGDRLPHLSAGKDHF